MPDGIPFPVVAPAEAIAYFRRKGFTFGFSWQDVFQEAHALAFTVAKAMTRDVLETIRAEVDRAIAEGVTLEEFRKELRPKLEQLGWWGKKVMIDPLTGGRTVAQLGSPRRLKTIFQVNLRTAYAAGRWERVQRQKAAFPYLRYVSVMDGRERPEHHAWHGTVLPADDTWWDTHYPPCGWNCRCTVQSFNAKMLERRGYGVTEQPVTFPARPWTNKRTGEINMVERGVDPGWSYNVGKAGMAAQAAAPIPDRFDGADIAAAGDAARAADAFLTPFGLDAGDAQLGRVFTDKGGWPLAMSLAWLQREGRLALPAPARRAFLGRAAATIVKPSEIRWVWVRGDNGAAMLFRRYVAIDSGDLTCAVDVGREGWRFKVREEGPLEQLRRGVLAWSAGG